MTPNKLKNNKMAKEKKTTKQTEKAVRQTPEEKNLGAKVVKKIECNDRLCPIHGDRKLKIRGRIFEGDVIKKLPGRVTIQFDRMFKLPKYERYEKRRTKIHARLPSCMEDDVNVGDRILIGETKPVSKTIHSVVTKVIRKKETKK